MNNDTDTDISFQFALTSELAPDQASVPLSIPCHGMPLPTCLGPYPSIHPSIPPSLVSHPARSGGAKRSLNGYTHTHVRIGNYANHARTLYLETESWTKTMT